MSDRKLTQSRLVIHPKAIAALGEEVCFVALEVARDLRSGAIPPDEYDQGSFDKHNSKCGAACCIAGHIALRMMMHVYTLLNRTKFWDFTSPASRLFAGSRPSDPLLAADAIERAILQGSDNPWMA